MLTIKPTKKLAVLVILYLSLITSFGAFAQEFQFAKGSGDIYYDYTTDIEVDPDGNIYHMGIFRSTVDFDPGVGVTELTTVGYTIFVTKSNASGELIWAKKIGGGEAEFGSSIRYIKARMELDASGNIFIAGTFNYTGDFDPGPGVTNLVPTNNEGLSDIFFTRWDTNGTMIWVKQIGGTSYDEANDIALNGSGNIFITGSYRNTVDFNPGGGVHSITTTQTSINGYIAEYTSAGDFVWAGGLFRGQTSTPLIQGSTVAVNSQGELFVGGYYEINSNTKQGYIAEISTTYNLTRDYEYQSTFSSEIKAIAIDENDNVYSTIDFFGLLDGLDASDGRILVTKILPNGAQEWKKQLGGGATYGYGRGIATGQLGEVYVIGEFGGTGDFDPSPGVLELTGKSFLAGLDEDGNLFRSAKAIDVRGASATPPVYGGFVSIACSSGRIYLGGAYEDGNDVNPSPTATPLSGMGLTDAFFSVLTPERETVSYTLDENASNQTVVGIVKIYGTPENYPFPSIVEGNTDGAFAIGDFGTANELDILVTNSAALDFEANPSFTIKIGYTDDIGDYLSTFYTIDLNDVAEGPEMADQTFTIISPVENGDEMGTISATSPESEPITFTLNSGNTDDAFSLDESTGIITVLDASLLDFSEPSTYTLNVTAEDITGSNSADITIELNVVPVFDWTSTTFSFDENATWLQSVPVSDADEDLLTLTIDSGDPDGMLLLADNAVTGMSSELWEISPNAAEGIDFETHSSFEIVFRAEDTFGNVTLSDPITININNLSDNDPTVGNETIEISEGLPDGSIVTTLNGEDLDNDELAYAIVSGNTNDAFVLGTSTGELTVNDVEVLVFATNPTFNLVVSVSDGVTIVEGAITINLFESLAPIIANQSFTVISTIETADEVGTIQATDAQGDDITFSLTSGNTDNAFALDGITGVLTVADRSVLDFTSPNFYTLTVSVSDGTDASSAEVTVVLNNAPVYNFETASFSFDENTQWPLLVPVTDPEGDELTVSIESGNTDNLLILENTANASNGMTVADAWEIFPASAEGIDFEMYQSFELIIKAEDELGNSTLSEPVTITINNLNDNAPTLENTTIDVSEGLPNGTVVTTVEAIDLDNDQLAYLITSGNTDNAFAIDTGSGKLTVANADAMVFATNPTFTLGISATDGISSANATLTINLLEASGPVIEDQAFNIISSIETGDEVGTVAAFDAQGDAITYAIVSGNTNDALALSSSTGVLTVADRALLDFSVANSFTLEVSASDAAETNSATIMVVLNTAPAFNWTTTTFDFNENEAWSLTVSVTDAESDELTLTITSGDEGGLFSIVNTAGDGSDPIYKLFPVANGIDFELDQTSFELIILAEDPFSNTTTSEAISISINNLNDNAPEIGDAAVSINQNLPNGIAVLTMEGTDADGDDLTYTLDVGNTADAFSIDATSGEIIVANSDALVFDTNPVFSLMVVVTDGTFTTSATATISLNEQAVNSAPIFSDQLFSLLENSENGTSVGTVAATDLEGDQLAFAIISGNSNNAFLLSSSTGELLVTNSEALDFESTPIFELLVSVSDGSFTETAIVSIELEDVEEGSVLAAADEGDALRIYPNPTRDYFFLTGGEQASKVILLDGLGKRVKEFEKTANGRYDVSGLKTGIYFLQLHTKMEVVRKKLLITE